MNMRPSADIEGLCQPLRKTGPSCPRACRRDAEVAAQAGLILSLVLPGEAATSHRIADGRGLPQLFQDEVELALDLIQAAQDLGEAVGRGHRSTQRRHEEKNETPATTSGEGLGWQTVRSYVVECQEALSLPHP